LVVRGQRVGRREGVLDGRIDVALWSRHFEAWFDSVVEYLSARMVMQVWLEGSREFPKGKGVPDRAGEFPPQTSQSINCSGNASFAYQWQLNL
jgi:hypothetical protein